MMDKNIQLSIIIPAFNSDDTISKQVDRISKVIISLNLSYEIIIVDDGSVDHTLQKIKILEEENNQIRIIHYSQNQGKGFAVRTGVLKSIGEYVMYTDSDLDISLDYLGRYIQQLKKYDIVIASKYHPESVLHVQKSRGLLSKLFTKFMHTFVGLNISDTQVGLKVGKGDILRKIFQVMKINGFAFDVELLSIATLLNIGIKEEPVILNPIDKYSTTQLIMLGFKMFSQLIVIGYNLKITKRYQKLFKNN